MRMEFSKCFFLYFILIYFVTGTLAASIKETNPRIRRRILQMAEFAPFEGGSDSSGGGGGGGAGGTTNDADNNNCEARPQKMRASNIAQKAAQEAKAAVDAQAAAGKEASRQVKSQLAEKAIQAAKAAEAALAGKQAFLDQLQKEVREAEAVVEAQAASLQSTQANVQVAIQAAQQATTQLKTLTGAVQTAQANVGNSEQAAVGAEQELAEKMQLLEESRNRVEQLLRQLRSARTDLASTKNAAYRASAAAHEAKINATRDKRRIKKRFISPPNVRYNREYNND